MTAAPDVLPLFPLGTVLYPGLLLPLNIFEPRYRELVRDLLQQPEELQQFGVIAIRHGWETGVDGVRSLYQVGCAAALRRVEEQEDGRYLLVTVGTRRFKLEALQDSSAAGPAYLQGLVTWIEEDPHGFADEAPALVHDVQVGFTAYLRALGDARGARIEVPDLPDDPGLLSYLVAAALVADVADKQNLLAAVTSADRLRAEVALLHREKVLLSKLTAAPVPELSRYPLSPN